MENTQDTYADREKQWQLKKAQQAAEFAELSAELEGLINEPSRYPDKLKRHADLLDCMLYAVLRQNLNQDKEYSYLNEDRINLALRIQKQCMDTLKTDGALDYMRAAAPYAPIPALIPALSPYPQNDEQTEGPWKSQE